MKNKNLYVVLMAGGSGTRFWPYSRKRLPKQFLDVLGTGNTLIKNTYNRYKIFCVTENIYVAANKRLCQLAKQQLAISDDQLMVEPQAKNTMLCIAYACYKIQKKNPDAIVVVSPSDHIVLEELIFKETIENAVNYASTQDKLITIGVKPQRPEIGYGYIQYESSSEPLMRVKSFVEKPNIQKATEYISRGDFLWNSGIFIWSVNAIQRALKRYQPIVAKSFEQLSACLDEQAEENAVNDIFQQCPSLSIDYGIMEKADNVYVVRGDFSWSDLGSWQSVYDASTKDNEGNTVDAQAMLYNTRNSIIKGSKQRLIVAQDLDGYLVGEFNNVFIVCKKEQESMFRRFVSDIKNMPEGDTYL